MQVNVRSPDGGTYIYDVVADVFQGNILTLCLFIFCLDYILRTSIDLTKENGFTLKMARSRLYPAQIITDANCAEDIRLLANIFTRVESLLLSQEQAAGGIGLHMTADKTEFMCFNKKRMHLPSKSWFSEIRGLIQVPRK